MASDKGIRAGKAYVEITTDQSKLVSGLAKAEANVRAFAEGVDRAGKAFAAIGAIGIAPFALGLKQLSAIDPQVAAELKQLKDAFNEIFIAIGQVTMNAIRPHIASIVSACKTAADWIRNNKALVLTILKVSAGLVALGATLVGLANAIKAVAAAISIMHTVVKVATVAFHLLSGAVSSFAAALGLSVGWVGLIIAGLVALGAYVLWSAGVFDAWGQAFHSVWGSILQALQGGQLGLAMRIAMAGLKLAIIQGWQKIVDWYMRTNSVSFFLRLIMGKKKFNELLKNFAPDFSGAVNGVKHEIQRLKSQIKPFKGAKMPNMPTAPALAGVANQITSKANTYAHLNGEAFTHLFGGLVDDDVPKQQLNYMKQTASNTHKTNDILNALEVG